MNLKSKDTDFIIEDGVLLQYTGKSKFADIPESVTSIKEYAFKDCKLITLVLNLIRLLALAMVLFMVAKTLRAWFCVVHQLR